MSRLRLTSIAPFGLVISLLLASLPAFAGNIGADPAACMGGNSVCTHHMPAYSFVSLTEGNVAETYSGPRVMSAFGPTLALDLIYNSYNADGTRTSFDTGTGFGWTHTYDDFLFTQGDGFFRWSGNGRITKFSLVNGTYQATPGYFETLAVGAAGSVTITDKYQTQYFYLPIARPVQDPPPPQSPISPAGAVLRLVSITDRNQNVTTLTYAGGYLSSVTDTYGRSITLIYNLSNHLSSVTDPLGRTTSLGYDHSGTLLTSITDPLGKVTTYSYNALNQIVSKVDRDQRTFTLSYQNNLPYSETDGNGGTIYTLTNTSNWATDPNQLDQNYLRVYIPSTTSYLDGRGNTWQYSYDGNGLPLTITAPDGAVTTYTYNPATLRVASVTACNGHAMHYQYDAQGNMVQSTDAQGDVTTYTYEPVFNQMTSMTDPNGRITTYTYDSRGNRLSETDPLNQTASSTYDSHGNVLSATDKRGNTTSYTYDTAGNRIQASDPLNEVTHYAYDGVGNRVSMTDPNGHTTTYQYDGLNRPTLQTDATGGTQKIAYDAESDRTSFTDENNHTTTYAYDVRQRLITTTDALGKPTTYTYDGNNNRLSMTDRNLHATTYAYDVQNRLVTTTDPLGNTTQRTYDCTGNLLSETDRNGHTNSFLYDPLNRVIRRTDALNHITTLGYDLTGLPGHPECTGPTLGSSAATSRIDPDGKIIYFAYDGLDRKTIDIHKQNGTDYQITPNDAVVYTAYDPNSNRTAVTEPDGNTTTYGYDTVNRQAQTTNAAGNTFTCGYDTASNLTTVNHPNGRVTTYGYDTLNRRTGETDSSGIVFTYGYDHGGNLLSKKDGNGNTTTYGYDSDNRTTTLKDPLCQSHSVCKGTVYVYDAGGNMLTETDFDGKTTTYGYDADDRRTSATNPLGNTSQTVYDNVGNVIERIDGNNHTTSYGYDAQDRKISETFDDPDHNTVSYVYDQTGKLVARTDQNGQTTSYVYSDLYYLTSRIYPSGTDNFTYDLSGRMLSASHGSWVSTFTYDGANRIVLSGQNGQTVSYAYDVPGRKRTITYPGGRVVTEQMDARDRETSINDGGPTPIVQYTYDAGDNVLTRALRNGTHTSYTHDQNYRVTQMSDSVGVSQFLGFQYAYDPMGNKQFEKKLHDLSHSETYGDNSIYELTDFKVGTLAGGVIQNPLTESTWDLDAVHNWNSRTTDGNPQLRTHTNSNEIASVDGNPDLSDFNGNLTDDGTSLYSYDEENRMTMVQDKVSGHINQQNQYDAFNRRVSTIDIFGTQTLYFYDGWRTIEERSSANLTQATYVFGNLPDEVLSMDRGVASFYYHTNALGTIVALSNSTGIAVEAYQYDAYGYQTIIQPGMNGVIEYGGDDTYVPGGKSFYDNPFLFTGQRYDPSTGLMYDKNRYYSTGLGRFMSRDPIGIWGDPLELGNGYAYVGDNPATFGDSSGLATNSVTVCESCHCPPPGASGPCDICCHTYTTLPQMTAGTFSIGPIHPGGTGPTYPGDPFPKGGPLSIAGSGPGSGIIIINDGWGMLAPSGGPSVIGPGSSGGESRADLGNVIYDKPMGDQQEDFTLLGEGIIGTQDGWGFLAPGGAFKGVDKAGPKLLTLTDSSIWGGGGSNLLDLTNISLWGGQNSWGYVAARKAGKDQQEYLKITLSDCLISSYHPSGSGGSDIIIGSEGWGCLAGSCRANPQSYHEQKPDGTLGGTTKMEFNLKTMKASALTVQPSGDSGPAKLKGWVEKGFDVLTLKPW